MRESKILFKGTKMKLEKLNPGAYVGFVRGYNIKKSNRTQKTYINLELDLQAHGQYIEVGKSYCLSIGSNNQIISLMESIGGMKDDGADFEELKKHYFRLDVSYDPDGQLRVDKISVDQIDDEENYYYMKME